MLFQKHASVFSKTCSCFFEYEFYFISQIFPMILKESDRLGNFTYICRKIDEMPTFFIVLFSLYLLGNLYIFLRGRQALRGQSTGVKVLLSILFWGCALLFFCSFLFRNATLPAAFARTCHEVGTGWLVFTLYMVILLALFDLLKLFNWKFKYAFYVSLGLTLSLLGYGYYHYQHPDTQVINLVINKSLLTGDQLPDTGNDALRSGEAPSGNGEESEENPDTPGNGENSPTLKIVAVSDIHLGYGTDKSMLKGYVERINALRPDLILIGGDLIDNSIVPLRAERMDEELSRLKAPLGIYMVPGNHEYISGIEASIDFIRQTPITLLRDTVVMLPNGIQLVGRDDRHNNRRQSLEELTANLDPSRPVILLDHQPYHLEQTEEAGVDLQFSGHTHHGQIWPLSILTDYLFELSYGHKQLGNSHIYVSSGLSLWGPPFRIGTDSELVVFDITFK